MKDMVTLGSTGITVNKNGFGALPIQRIAQEDAVHLARKAYKAGIRFFDTARAYTDSEVKLGEAFDGIRSDVYLATKTAAETAEDFWKALHTSLKNLRTDYIDIYQFHARSRMILLLRRAPGAAHLSPEGQAKMKKIEDCLHCNQCRKKCPYGLDTPALLARNYEDYKRVLAGEVKV